MIAEIVLLAVCMVMAALFSGIETGVISIHRVRIRHLVERGVRRARILQSFLDRPDRLLVTVLVGTNICVVVCSVIGASLAMRILPEWGKLVSSVLVTVVLLIFSEFLPKAWFQARPLERSLVFADVLEVAFFVLRPIGVVINAVTDLLVPRPSHHHARIQKPFVTREDLKTLTHELSQHGAISSEELAMIERVFELSGKVAGKIMKPRSEMVPVNDTMTIAAFLETARRAGFRRYPVYSEYEKRFVGIVSIADILSAGPEDMACTVADYMRSSQFIPDYMPVDDILPRMKRTQQAMLLVTDAHSNVVGLVTTENVLAEVFARK
ncbi:MAG: CNNM domain-containing protein [bacterium]